MNGSMELIVGTKRVQPKSVEWIEGGLVARMDSTGFLSLVDATFSDISAEVQLLGADQQAMPRAMVVTAITMRGHSAFVTLHDTGLRPALH